ncbi:hypothetical protein CABS01_08075, partial [Colletotrichum abscissum]|uniref:uncharacterized protein n=1 Tax=Colletotrichum abscissum TaxID=1671311 RepID=UPI0027D658D4
FTTEDEFLKWLELHRSLALLFKRASTALITHNIVGWEGSLTSLPSIVYNCKSDIESPPPTVNRPDDVALSVTSFPTLGTAYAAMYGCTQPVIESTIKCLEDFGGQAFHPLAMPVIFAELERARLVGLLDREKEALAKRILELENKLRGEDQSSISEKADSEPTSQTRDSTTYFKSPVEGSNKIDEHAEERRAGSRIEMRLREMVDELGSKIRSCEALLGGMSLAAQMESNYYTRRDAKVSIIIANATKRDGSQMRSISLLGMIFLPGTFLASLFSMSFFNWTPPDGNQIISPWIALYGVLVIVITLITVWGMRKWMEAEEKKAREQMAKEVNSDGDSIV